MSPDEREKRVRAHSARLARHLAERGSEREDIELVLGNGVTRADRARAWMEEYSFWTDYSQEYPNLRKTGPYRRLCVTIGELITPQRNETWWDAGCGPLSMTEVIWERSGGQIGWIGATDIVLGSAQERLPTLPFSDRLDLVARTLGASAPFVGGTLDGIVSNLVVPYITLAQSGRSGRDAVEFVMSEFFRVLRPGGTLVWSTPRQGVQFAWVFVASIPDMMKPANITDPRQGPAILKRALMIQRKGRDGIYSFLSKKEWEEMLSRVGFSGPVIWKTAFARQAWVCKVTKPSV